MGSPEAPVARHLKGRPLAGDLFPGRKRARSTGNGPAGTAFCPRVVRARIALDRNAREPDVPLDTGGAPSYLADPM